MDVSHFLEKSLRNHIEVSFFIFLVNITFHLFDASSDRNIEEGLVQATGSRSGLKSGSTNGDGIVTLGSFVAGEEIIVQVSIPGLLVDLCMVLHRYQSFFIQNCFILGFKDVEQVVTAEANANSLSIGLNPGNLLNSII